MGRGTTTRVRRGGISWDLDLSEAIDFSIYLLGGFEVRLVRRLARLARPGDVVVDVGANVGCHVLPLARAVGHEGQVIAYEPSSFAYRKLLANLALNPELARRVSPFQLMVAAHPDAPVPRELYASWPLIAEGVLHPVHFGRAVETQGARAITLDEHLPPLGIERVDLIKLDVDGRECEVLQGAVRVLDRHRPVIVMEWAPYVHAELGHRLEDCLAVPMGLGYRFRDAVTGEPLTADLALATSHIGPGASVNVEGHSGGEPRGAR